MNDGEGLSACGCCDGIGRVTPGSIANLPGLSALAWRAGTQARFKRSMLAALSGQPALRPLTSRDDDDPSIALLDAWATSLDVLTFYQERIANENYLRTATELRSVLELARAIGYELAPGVSASTLQAFNLETSPGAPLAAKIPAGTKTQSIPGQDEKPHVYETASELAARAVWNSLPARTRDARTPYHGQSVIHLAGLSTGLQTGDGLLLVGDERVGDSGSENWDFRRIRTVKLVGDSADPSRSHTEIALDRPLGSADPYASPAKKDVRVFAMRQRAALFGHNAMDFRLLPASTQSQFGTAGGSQWAGFTIGYTDAKPASLDKLHLDAAHKAAVAGAWAVVCADNVVGGQSYEELYRIEKAEESAKAVFGVSGKSTKVTLSGENLVEKFWTKLREVAVFLQTDELTLVERPLTELVAKGATAVDLDMLLSGDDGLPDGRTLLITGIDADTGGPAAESVTLKHATKSGGGAERELTRLEFESQLIRSYRRDTVRVLGNVAGATNGETKKDEVLGSGNGSATFQSFTLKQRPLTYVPASNAAGRSTTLEIRVDGVRWKEAPTFYGVGPDERVYTTRRSDSGVVTVRFGDGKTGARLPTGVENVVATYRVGTGLEGLVKAGQISLMMSRPLGVKEVTNPQPGEGADDPEKLTDARQNAPLTVLTLDRIVSLSDYEDFARAFAGIGKATAALLWTGQQESVHLTLAAADGTVPAGDSKSVADLRRAIDLARHPLRTVLLQGHVARPFTVSAKVAVDPAYETDAVLGAVRQALVGQFAFASRGFGEDVTVSQVLAAMEAVTGVVFAGLDALAFVGGAVAKDGRLEARTARLDPAGVHPADLLTLASADIHLLPTLP